jgi:hypothetical protein
MLLLNRFSYWNCKNIKNKNNIFFPSFFNQKRKKENIFFLSNLKNKMISRHKYFNDYNDYNDFNNYNYDLNMNKKFKISDIVISKMIKELFPNMKSEITLESDYPYLRNYILSLINNNDINKNNRNIIQEKIIAYLSLNTFSKSSKQINSLIEIVSHFIAQQLEDRGCKFNTRDFLTKNLYWVSKDKQIKDDQPYWVELSLSLPSDDKNNILIGRQYIFIFPSILDFKNKDNKSSINELYRILLGDLALEKIKNNFLNKCVIQSNDSNEIPIEISFNDEEIIYSSSYNYLHNLYKCSSLEEIFSLSNSFNHINKSYKNDLIYHKILIDNTGNILWTKFIITYNNIYNSNKIYYDNIHKNNYNILIICLTRSLDLNGNINIKNFNCILSNYL